MKLLLLLPLLCFELLTTLTLSLATTAYPTITETGAGDCSLLGRENTRVPNRREVYGDGRIFDISHRYTTDMPTWDSQEGLGKFLWLRKSMKNGSLANNSEMKMPTHTGTHVDAPGHVFDHYFDAGFDVDTLDLELLNGNWLKIDSVYSADFELELDILYWSFYSCKYYDSINIVFEVIREKILHVYLVARKHYLCGNRFSLIDILDHSNIYTSELKSFWDFLCFCCLWCLSLYAVVVTSLLQCLFSINSTYHLNAENEVVMLLYWLFLLDHICLFQ